MKEILLTSSVLILALLLLRLLFRKTISRQVQYALWGLVALRLLVPVSLPAMEHNVLTAAEPVTARITAPALYVTPYRETIVSAPPGVFQTPAPYQSFRVDTATEDSTVTFTDGKNVTHSIEYKSQIPLTPVLKAVWHAGMYVMAAWFLLTNLRFMLRLRRSRTTLPGGKLPLSGVSDGGAALPLSVRPVSPRRLPDPRRRGIPGDPAACSDPRDHPRPPSGPPVEPAAVRVSGGVLVRPAGVGRRHRLPPGLRAGL